MARSEVVHIMVFEEIETMQALILAGGEGRRMRHVTAQVPKPLLYLPGGTLLEHQLALLAELGVSQTYVVIHHHSDQMKRALRGLPAVSTLPQRPPFTLLGALASAEGCLTEPFMVLHGDNYFSQGLQYLIEAAQGTPSGPRVDAVFLVESETRHLDEARHLASTGCYVLSPEILKDIRAFQDGDELWHLTAGFLDVGAVVEAVPLRGWRKNVNRLEDLLMVSRRLLDDWSAGLHTLEAGKGLNRTEGLQDVRLPVWIAPDSKVSNSHLGPYVVVGPRARVRDCALSDVIVFPGAAITQLELDRGVVIPTRVGSMALAPEDEIHTR